MLLATPEDMRAIFGHAEIEALTQSHAYAEAPEQEPDEAAALGVLQKALADASDTAGSYLVGRYPVFRDPAAPQGFALPKSLNRAVCDIARYYLTGAGALETDPIVTRYKLAMAWLKDIADGKASLPMPQEENTQTGGSVMFYSGTRQWSRTVSEADE